MTDPKPIRWYRLTPDRLVIGLLVVEGLLWLSERCQWFRFNEKKGWTVLIAVAAVGVAMILMLLWFVASLLFRWRFQFSIRSLLVLTVAVAMPCSWLAVEMREAMKQRDAVMAITKLGGQVIWLEPSGSAWLWSLLGDDFFRCPFHVNLLGTQITDAGLRNLKGLNQLKGLWLDSSKVTDTGLEDLKGLKQLQVFWLSGTKATDEGLRELQQALPKCRIVR